MVGGTQTTKKRINRVIESIRVYYVACSKCFCHILSLFICDRFSMVVVDFSSLCCPKSLGGCLFSTCFEGVTQGHSANPTGSARKTARFGDSVVVLEVTTLSVLRFVRVSRR